MVKSENCFYFGFAQRSRGKQLISDKYKSNLVLFSRKKREDKKMNNWPSVACSPMNLWMDKAVLMRTSDHSHQSVSLQMKLMDT